MINFQFVCRTMSETINKALVKACEAGEFESAHELLSQGADVNFVRQPFGWTPLTSALFGKHQRLVQLLLDTPDIDVDMPNSGGMTPLHMACDTQNTSAIDKIIQKSRASLNLKTSSGCTPLMVAATYNKLESVQALVNMDGVDLNTKNFRGKSLDDVAKNFPEILSLIRAARSKHTANLCTSCSIHLSMSLSVFKCDRGHYSCGKCRDSRHRRCQECGAEFGWRGFSWKEIQGKTRS